MTWVAVGCLTLDGVLLGLAGLWSRRAGLVLGGLICLLLALGIVYLWRRHRRALEELRRARREVADEVRALRELVRRPPPA
jgi:uncharacterized iron-regulated membrane protein